MAMRVTQADLDRLVASGLFKLVDLDKPTMADWIAKQSAKDDAGTKPKRRTKPLMVPECFVPPATWLIPVEVVSEANKRGHWSKHHGRKASQQRAVSRAMGRHLRVLADFADALHEGKPVKVMLTKLGGRKVDKSNLARAFKGVEDACCLILGADDGAANWRIDWQWESNPRVGVKVELELLKQE